MKGLVIFRDDDNVLGHPDEPDAYFNATSDKYVLLRPPSNQELRDHLEKFEERIRGILIEYLLTNVGEAKDRFGTVGLNEKLIEGRRSLELGLVYTGGPPQRFTFFQTNAVTQAVIELGLVSARTPKGTRRKRLRGLATGIATFVESQPREMRQRILHTVFDIHDDLDDVLNFAQTSAVGWRALNELVKSNLKPADILEEIATRTEAFFTEQKSRGTQTSTAYGTGRIYGPPWFAQHLSTEGVWLQPPNHIGGLSWLFPSKLEPAGVRFCTPDRHREMADAIIEHRRRHQGTSTEAIQSMFLGVLQSTNVWRFNNLRAWPLAHYREWIHAKAGSKDVRSSSLNGVYRISCAHFNQHIGVHPAAPHFVLGLRSARTGLDVFSWCDRPTPRNTRKAEKCLGHPIEEVPVHVKEWAQYLREILVLFENKTLSNTTNVMNSWLIYLLTLNPTNAPHDFSEVVRHLHVSDGNSSNTSTYVSFMLRNYSRSSTNLAERSISTMKNAWLLAANRDGYSSRLTCPFDTATDSLRQRRSRLARTSRQSLDQTAAEIIVRENRKNNFEFSKMEKSGGRWNYHFTLKNADTKRVETVFMPVAPTLIDVILNTGLRKISARWIDSGEGDEFIADVDSLNYRPNPLPTATPGRQESFVTICDVDDRELRRVIGMYVGLNKTGKRYTVPYIERGALRSVLDLARLQRSYNPIQRPVAQVEPNVRAKYTPADKVALIYPLFRDPDNGLNHPVSPQKIDTYWRALLQHCQPLVNESLGYDYPLLIGDRPRFDIHSLRVTMVTILSEKGVPMDIIQMLVGHSTVMMTWYYKRVSDGRIHRELQRAIEGQKQNAEPVHFDDASDFSDVADEAVTSVDVDDPIGLDYLRKHNQTKSGSIDEFTHGICAGGDCSTGGRRQAEGRYAPVFRPRACSRCRHRVTGPRYINGIVFRINCLLFEIKQSIQIEEKLNGEAGALEDSGKPFRSVRSLAVNEREKRDELLAEWAAEIHILEACKSKLHQSTEDPSGFELGARALDLDPAGIDLIFAQAHDFELANMLITDSRFMSGSQLGLPPGIEEWRDIRLLEIIAKNNLSQLFTRLDRQTSREAFDMLADSIIESTRGQNLLQDVIDGVLSLKDLGLLDNVEQSISTLTEQSNSANTYKLLPSK